MKKQAVQEKSSKPQRVVLSLLIINSLVVGLLTFSFILNKDETEVPSTPQVLSVEDYSISEASLNDIPLSYPLGTISDETPLFDWNPVSFPDLSSYQVFLNNNLIATVAQTQSEYQYTGQALNSQHSWKVNGVKADNTVLASSITQGFAVKKSTNLTLLSPTPNFITDSMRPFFKWDSSFQASVYHIFLNSSLYTVVPNNVNNEYLAPTNLSPGQYSWYVAAYYTGLGSLGVPVSTEIGKSSTQEFEIEAIYNLTLRTTIDDDDIIEVDDEDPSYSQLGLNVRFLWTKGGTEPPINSFYRFRILDKEGEQLLFVDNIPVTIEAYTLKLDELEILNTNEIYEARIELLDANQNILDSRKATLLYTYSPEPSVLIPIGDDSDVIDDSNTVKILGLTINLPREGEELVLLMPMIVSAALVLIASILSLHNIPKLLLEKLIEKQQNFWGIIYDPKDNTPIPFAKVQLINDANKLVEEVESDVKGRYAFLLKIPGTFKLQVQLPGYESANEELRIDKAGEEVVGDIRMQRIAEDKPLKIKIDQSLGIVLRWINIIFCFLMILGFIYTLLILVNNPIAITLFILSIYGLLVTLNLAIFFKQYQNLVKRGEVVDIENNEKISGVVLRFYQQMKLSVITISGSNGKIRSAIKPGNYKLRINKPGYEFTRDNKDNSITGLINVFINEKGKLDSPIKIKKEIISKPGDLGNPFNGK